MKDYLFLARNCWGSIKNVHHLPPATYGMKISYERKIKELQGEIEQLRPQQPGEWIVQLGIKKEIYDRWIIFLRDLGFQVFGRYSKIKDINNAIFEKEIKSIMEMPKEEAKLLIDILLEGKEK